MTTCLDYSKQLERLLYNQESPCSADDTCGSASFGKTFVYGCLNQYFYDRISYKSLYTDSACTQQTTWTQTDKDFYLNDSLSGSLVSVGFVVLIVLYILNKLDKDPFFWFYPNFDYDYFEKNYTRRIIYDSRIMLTSLGIQFIILTALCSMEDRIPFSTYIKTGWFLFCLLTCPIISRCNFFYYIVIEIKSSNSEYMGTTVTTNKRYYNNNTVSVDVTVESKYLETQIGQRYNLYYNSKKVYICVIICEIIVALSYLLLAYDKVYLSCDVVQYYNSGATPFLEMYSYVWLGYVILSLTNYIVVLFRSDGLNTDDRTGFQAVYDYWHQYYWYKTDSY